MALTDFGEVPASSVLPIMWSSHDGATGANEALSGLAVTDIEVFKGTSMTQRSSDAGYVLLDTDGIDIDGMVGANGISIDLGDNTDAGFYGVGSFYNVWIASVTIDGQTVNIHLATFRIKAAEHTAGYVVATVKDGTGTGEIDTTSGGVLVAAIAANAITATAINADAITNAKIADNAIAVENIADNAITAAKIAADAITAAKIAAGAIDAATFAADVDAEILSYIVDDATRIDASALNTAAVTSIPAILVDTGTTLDAMLATLLGRTVVAAGLAQGDGSSTNTIQLASGGVTSDDQFNGGIIALVSGTGTGQQRYITDSVNTGDELTVDGDWDTAPDATSRYIVFMN